MSSRRYSVVVPFHRNVPQLDRCLSALVPADDTGEVIVVADGPIDDPTDTAARYGATLLRLPRSGGPAVARNRGAAAASGRILVFVDADVVARPGTIPALCQTLEGPTAADAVFGAYDESPEAPHFVSQYRNLAHSYVHQRSSGDATTFWAGLGAVRAEAFWAVGGFDERFRRPCVEDIELGYRLTLAGYRIRLTPELRGTHLKRWTLWSSVVSDVRDRGVPWMQLLSKYRRQDNALNVRTRDRLTVALAWAAAGLAAACVMWPPAALGAALSLAAFVVINRDYYAYFARVRGGLFAVRILPFHVLHHLCNGVSFIVGRVTLAAPPPVRSRLRWALPMDRWTATSVANLKPADAASPRRTA